MLKLPSGNYINLNKIVSIINVDPDYFAHFDKETMYLLPNDAQTILAAIEAPVQIKTFGAADQNPDLVIQLVQDEANKFLSTLQPWQVVSINPQSSVSLTNPYSITLYTITITYREPKATE